MKDNQFAKLLAFLERLDQAKISSRMELLREEALMIIAFAPGEY
jgi:hypothetical protein